MSRVKKFRTKNGYCHVLPDRLVFIRRNAWGKLGDLVVEGKMSRLMMLFGLLTALDFYFAWYLYSISNLEWAILFGLIGIYLVYAIIKSADQSVHPIIDRSKITDIRFNKAIEALTPPTIEIRFRDPNGKKKKRTVSLKFGEEQQAITVLKVEGLMS